jgi:hypothetical protein
VLVPADDVDSLRLRPVLEVLNTVRAGGRQSRRSSQCRLSDPLVARPLTLDIEPHLTPTSSAAERIPFCLVHF